MWASGVIMYAMLCGELPFDHDDQQSSFRLIAKGKYHPVPPQISADARSLLDSLLCVDKAGTFVRSFIQSFIHTRHL